MKLAIFATIVASASAWAPQLKKVDFAQVSIHNLDIIRDEWVVVSLECTYLTRFFEWNSHV